MLISIKWINPAKAGGKYGSVKAVDGTTIMVPPDLLGLFQAGTTVEIATKQQTWGQGTDQEKVVTIATSGPLQGHTVPVQGQGGQAGYQRPVQNQAPYRPNTGFRPRVVEGGPVGMPSGSDQARQIYVTGIVGRAMGSGKFTASEIRVLTAEANAAFDLIGKPPVTRAEPPLGLEPDDPGPAELQ